MRRTIHLTIAVVSVVVLAALPWPALPGASLAQEEALLGPSPAGVSWVWHVETVDAGGIAGEYASLVLGSDGYPRIAYYDRTAPGLNYAWWDGTTWHVEQVDQVTDAGRYCSLAMDPSTGMVHVSYYDAALGDLKTAHRLPGGAWHTVYVDQPGDVGQWTSIAVDPATHLARIAYYDVTNQDLKYAEQYGNPDWHTFYTSTLDSAGDAGKYASIALDASGYPHVGYYYQDGTGAGYLKYAYQDAGGWHFEVADGEGGLSDVGRDTSLALDAGGYPHITCQQVLPSTGIRYVYRDAGGWHGQTIVSGSAGDPSMALDASGHPHVSYDDYRLGGPRSLAYARYDGATWRFETVESAADGSYFDFPWLQLSSSGHPRIAYALANSDHSDYDLKYAYACIWARVSHAPEPACVYNPVQFTNATTGTLPLTYRWDFGDGYSSTEAEPAHSYASAGVYTATLAATATCGVDVAVQTVVISSTPEASFSYTPAEEICAGEEVRFDNTTVGSPTLSYLWNFGDGSFSDQPDPVHAYAQAGTYQVTLVAMNGCGYDTYRTNVVVNGVPRGLGLTWEPALPEVGQTVTFTASATSTLPITYTWDFGDGQTGSGRVTGHAYAGVGTYTVTLSAANHCGESAATAAITVACYPVTSTRFAWTPLEPVSGEVVSFTAAASGTAPLSYEWAFGDGSSGSGALVAHSYAAGGDYTVTLTATNFCGQQVVTRTVSVCGPATGPDFTWDPPDPVVDAPITFTAGVSGTEPITYTWDLGDGSSGSGAVTTHTYGAGGTYSVALTTANGCGEGSVRHTVSVCGPADLLGLAWDPPTPTAGTTTIFTATAVGSPSPQCTWSFGDGVVTTGPCDVPVAHAYARSGTFTITLDAQNDCGAATLAGTIRVVQQTVAAFSDDAPACAGGTVAFTNTSSGEAPLSFRWDFGDGGTAAVEDPTHTYEWAGSYTVTLTATNAYGTDRTSRPVEIWSGVSRSDLSWQPALPPPGATVTFTAAASGTAPISCEWDFGDGYTGAGTAVAHTYATTGTYTVWLTTTNACGQEVVTGTIKVAHCTQPAGLGLAYSPDPPVFGRPATFTATLAAGSAPLDFYWLFGDGTPPQTGQIVAHTFAHAGAYTITLAAWNECGSRQGQFRVEAAEPTFRVYLPLAGRSYWGDPYEPDGTAELARGILLSTPQRHSFDPTGDQDWAYLDLGAGHTYRFWTQDLAGGADTRLFLYLHGQYASAVAENDDWGSGNCGGAAPDPKASCFTFTPATGGRYELLVDQYPAGAGWGPQVQYTVQAQQMMDRSGRTGR